MPEKDELNQDLLLIKETLVGLNNRQSKMESSLIDIKGDMGKIKTRMLGDEQYNQTGLVDDVNTLKQYVQDQKTQKDRIYGGVAVIMVLWGFVWEFIKAKFVK